MHPGGSIANEKIGNDPSEQDARGTIGNLGQTHGIGDAQDCDRRATHDDIAISRAVRRRGPKKTGTVTTGATGTQARPSPHSHRRL